MRFIAVLCLAAWSFAAPSHAAHAGQTINVYNWSDYIAPQVLKQFQKETGIRVQYDTYDSNEVLESKLLVTGSGYDVVFPTARPYADRHMQHGVYLALDKKQLPNLKNLDPVILRSLLDIDPANKHVLPYTWGTTGIGYNRDKVLQRLGAKTPLNTWALLFDPKNAAKLKDCGIAILDDPEEALHAMLIYLGRDPNSARPEDLAAAIAAYKLIHPYIKYFHSSQYLNDLAGGDICIAMGYSGDVIQARNRASEAKNGVHVAYAHPQEGSIMWVDLMAIPKDAPHAANAHKFVNFLLRGDIMATISNEIAYANANAAALPLLTPAIRNDLAIYPDNTVRARLKTARSLAPDERRARSRAFTRIRTGT